MPPRKKKTTVASSQPWYSRHAVVRMGIVVAISLAAAAAAVLYRYHSPGYIYPTHPEVLTGPSIATFCEIVRSHQSLLPGKLTFYEILGVGPEADSEEIARAYFAAVERGGGGGGGGGGDGEKGGKMMGGWLDIERCDEQGVLSRVYGVLREWSTRVQYESFVRMLDQGGEEGDSYAVVQWRRAKRLAKVCGW